MMLCLYFSVDGNWSNWSKWSQCDVTCGKGTQTRIRLCNNPAPKNGGNECLGNEMSTKSCFVELCPGTSFIIKWPNVKTY